MTDQTIPADKVQEVIDMLSEDDAVIRPALEALLPKPQTLADELRAFEALGHWDSEQLDSFADRVETLEQERDEAQAEIVRLRDREIPDGWRIAEHPQLGTVIASADLDGKRGLGSVHHCVFRSNVGPGISQTWATPAILSFRDEAPAPEETPEHIDPASCGKHRTKTGPDLV